MVSQENIDTFFALLTTSSAPEKRSPHLLRIPRALDKAALAFRHTGNIQEAAHLPRELRERYPNYAGG